MVAAAAAGALLGRERIQSQDIRGKGSDPPTANQLPTNQPAACNQPAANQSQDSRGKGSDPPTANQPPPPQSTTPTTRPPFTVTPAATTNNDVDTPTATTATDIVDGVPTCHSHARAEGAANDATRPLPLPPTSSMTYPPITVTPEQNPKLSV